VIAHGTYDPIGLKASATGTRHPDTSMSQSEEVIMDKSIKIAAAVFLALIFLMGTVSTDNQNVVKMENPEKIDAKKSDSNRAAYEKSQRLSMVIGSKVINYQGEVLGVVEDLVANEEGKLVYLVLSKIGATGVMAKFVAIPLDAVSPRITAQGQLSIDVDQATLDEAPTFAAGEFPDFEDGRWQQESRGYFENGETSPNDRKKRSPGMLQEGIRVVIALR
jgi:sporulation protein YlmC with PRC-barrel domain/preprotein translocase subunit SecG